ncbi:MAG: DUF1801 domain-containing protein [candidate division Zixibacteria bacterium]|nr:DUF1801 domain-containing protein [candidate division Zixibacteria bacterium]
MKKSKDKKVHEFLEDVLMIDSEKYEIMQKLRKIVFDIFPKSNERMMYGGIMFSLEDDFGGIFIRKNHISFEFSSGVHMDDPDNILEGKGKFRRHLKIRSMSDIKDKTVEFFIKQAL